MVYGVDGNAGEGGKGDQPANRGGPLRVLVAAQLQWVFIDYGGECNELQND